MSNVFHTNKKAFGLLEIIVVLVIVVGAAIPILRMVTGSRKETSSSVNYLRAMELADEAIEWANLAKFDEVDKLKNLSGTILEDNGTAIVPIKINTTTVDYPNWVGSEIFSNELKYSEQYSNAYFYRDIDVQPVVSSNIANNLLKKVVVTVKWSEGYKPSNLNDPSNRSRQIQLSVLVINDENLIY